MKFLICFGCILGASIKVVMKTMTRVDEHEIFAKFIGEPVNSVPRKNCKQSTWAQMVVQDAIDEWNGGNLEYDLQDITIE